MNRNSTVDPHRTRDFASPPGNPRQFQFVAVCVGSILLAGSLFITVRAYGKLWGHSAKEHGFAAPPATPASTNAPAAASGPASSFE